MAAEHTRPFDPEHLCPKCGAEGARPEHHEQPVLIVFGAPQWPCSSGDRALAEHLCVKCGGCGFAWIETVPGDIAAS